MKSELKAKLLRHLAAKKGNAGFTLIELLVVIIIIGILSAIALPSFLNQANKAKQSEAKTYVGSMNRAQQAFYLEKNGFVNGTFAPANNPGTPYAIEDLGLGINQSTEYYNYTVCEDLPTSVTNAAEPKAVNGTVSSLKAYKGGVSIGTQSAGGEATILATLCEATKPRIDNGGTGPNGSETITLDITTNAPVCNTAYEPVK